MADHIKWRCRLHGISQFGVPGAHYVVGLFLDKQIHVVNQRQYQAASIWPSGYEHGTFLLMITLSWRFKSQSWHYSRGSFSFNHTTGKVFSTEYVVYCKLKVDVDIVPVVKQ